MGGEVKARTLGKALRGPMLLFSLFHGGNSYFSLWEVEGSILWEALGGPISLCFISSFQSRKYLLHPLGGERGTLWEAVGRSISMFCLPFQEGNTQFTFWEFKKNTLWEALGGPISMISFLSCRK
jgi:hypothetical protein